MPLFTALKKKGHIRYQIRIFEFVRGSWRQVRLKLAYEPGSLEVPAKTFRESLVCPAVEK